MNKKVATIQKELDAENLSFGSNNGGSSSNGFLVRVCSRVIPSPTQQYRAGRCDIFLALRQRQENNVLGP